MDALLDAYAATWVHITEHDGSQWLVQPTGDQHQGWERGPAPSLATAAEAWIVTAHNPFSQPLPPSVNAERSAAMLRIVQWHAWGWLPAVGRSPDGDWSEDGLLLTAAPRAAVIDLARDFDQNAVFRWTPTSWSIVGVHLSGEWVQGWRGSRVRDGGQVPSPA